MELELALQAGETGDSTAQIFVALPDSFPLK